jgi:hypothetical protein
VLKALLAFLRSFFRNWLGEALKFLGLFCRLFQQPERKTPEGCVPITHPAFVRPDPLIYSQRYLMAQGLAVTWDNPDIALFKAGLPVSSAELTAGTTYEVKVRIWNNSTEAPVVQMPVHLSYLDFGIGTQAIAIDSTKVDVGVKGSVDQPRSASFFWTTPTNPGHYCLQVLLDPADDLNMANNLGQENTDVVAAHSPAVFKFKLRNNTQNPRSFRFEWDAYQIPALSNCDGPKVDRNSKRLPHLRENYPVPAGFDVEVSPATPSLNPSESVDIVVKIEPPPGFVGRQTLNLNAFHELGFVGGVTLTTVKEI